MWEEKGLELDVCCVWSFVFEFHTLLPPLRLCFVCYKWTVTQFSFVSACTVGNLFFAICACFQASVDVVQVREVVGNVIADVFGVCLNIKLAIWHSKVLKNNG